MISARSLKKIKKAAELDQEFCVILYRLKDVYSQFKVHQDSWELVSKALNFYTMQESTRAAVFCSGSATVLIKAQHMSVNRLEALFEAFLDERRIVLRNKRIAITTNARYIAFNTLRIGSNIGKRKANA